VVKHFNDEESIQRLRNYPGYETHKKEHGSFVARLKVLKQEISTEGLPSTILWKPTLCC
jgi:hemerythrin